MPRHKQPLEIAILKGSVRRNPQRYKGKSASSGLPLGEPPDHLSAQTREAWKDLEQSSLPGVLQGSDRFIMEVTAGLLAEFRNKPYDFTAGKYRSLLSCLGRIGLTPLERQKVGVVAPGTANAFDEF
jgi:hypothetical protein